LDLGKSRGSLKVFVKCSCKIQRPGRSLCFIIYHAVLLKFAFYRSCSYATAHNKVHKTFVGLFPVRVSWHSESPIKRLQVLFRFFMTKGQIPMQSFKCMNVSVANENDVLSTKTRSTQRQRHR
jgi:hypothetical protein